MIVLQTTNLTKAFGVTEVLKGVTLTVQDHHRVGLVGSNGSGKSTLLKILAGQDHYDNGNLAITRGLRIGFHTQLDDLTSPLTVWQEMETCFEDTFKMEEKLRQMEQQMGEVTDTDTEEFYRLTEDYAKLMDRPLLAVYDKLERFFRAQKFISHIVIAMSSIYPGHHIVQSFTADLLSWNQVHSVHKKKLLLGKHSLDLDFIDHKGISMEVKGLGLMLGLVCAGSLHSYHSQKRVLSLGSLPSADYDGIDCLLAETHHIVFGKVWLYLDIRYLYILFEGIHTEHVDSLTDDVTDVVHLHI